jgi:hypothetical protein
MDETTQLKSESNETIGGGGGRIADLLTRGIKMKICTLGSDFHTSVQKRPFCTLVWKIGGHCAKIFAH